MREGKQTALTRIRGGYRPQLRLWSRSNPLGGTPGTGVRAAQRTGGRAGGAGTRDRQRRSPHSRRQRLARLPAPPDRALIPAPAAPAAPRTGPAPGPRPRARPRRFCANTSCPRPGSLQRARSPPRRWFLPGAGIPPSRPPGGWFLPGPIISSPSQQSPPSPPRKYSAHKYGG